MFVKRKPLWVESEALVHLHRRHPLRNIPVNGERQAQEIMRLFFVVEVKLEDAHSRKNNLRRLDPSGIALTLRASLRRVKRYMDLARCAICARSAFVSLSIVRRAPR